MEPRAAVPVMLMLLLGQACREPPPVYREWADGYRGVADVVPGQSYVGTDTYYIDEIEPEYIEDSFHCTMTVEATADDVRDDCQDCIFAFEVHFGTSETVDACVDIETLAPPALGYGVRGTAPPVLMVLWERSDGLQWEPPGSPLVTVTFDGTRLTFDHFFASSWDNIPE